MKSFELNDPEFGPRKEYASHKLLLPDDNEWRVYFTAQLIDGLPVDKLCHPLIRRAVALGAHSTQTVATFLIAPNFLAPERYMAWKTVMLRWPSGKPDLMEGQDLFHEPVQRVYFGEFHCFDCGADFEAYAIDRDAYLLFSTPTPVLGVSALGCPKCGGPARRPGLVEYFDHSSE